MDIIYDVAMRQGVAVRIWAVAQHHPPGGHLNGSKILAPYGVLGFNLNKSG
jgi:hypothetical protein